MARGEAVTVIQGTTGHERRRLDERVASSQARFAAHGGLAYRQVLDDDVHVGMFGFVSSALLARGRPSDPRRTLSLTLSPLRGARGPERAG